MSYLSTGRVRLITRRFLVGFNGMSIDAAQVKSGLNSRETVVACRCINVGLFVSDDLRRDVEVSLCIGHDLDLRIISFSGEKIKRVSPDERSISFFLLKAMQLLDEMDFGRVRSTDNGIVLSRTNSKDLVTSWSTERVHVADRSAPTTDWSFVSTGGLFVYDMSDVLSRGFTNSSTSLLHRPQNPERFILDANMHCDLLEASLLKKAS